MARILCIAGTHGRHADWANPTSAFAQALRQQGHTVLHEPAWAGFALSLDGVFGFDRAWNTTARLFLTWLNTHAHTDWIITHSHAGNCLALAAYLDWIPERPFPSVITCGTPVRRNLRAAYAQLARKTTRWVHCYTPHDYWQIFGTISARSPIPNFTRTIHACEENLCVQLPIQSWAHTQLVQRETWQRNGLYAILDQPFGSGHLSWDQWNQAAK